MTYEPPGPGPAGGAPPVNHAHAAVAEIHRVRLKMCKAGTWPQHSIRTWTEIARQAGRRPDGVSPSPLEQRALEVCQAAGVKP